MATLTQLELEVDRFGRVLIPKRIRDALNLSPGSKLTADLSGQTLTLRAEEARSTLDFGPDGWPVIGLNTLQSLPTDFDPVRELADERSAEQLARW